MNRSSIAAGYALMVTLVAGVAFAQQRSLMIRALDGKSGKPLLNQQLVIFGGRSEEDAKSKLQHFEARTAADGTAVITIGPETQWIQVWVDRFVLCQDKPNFRAFPVDTIVHAGESSPNNCGRATAKNIPGTFAVFARRPSFWDTLDW